MSLKLDAAALPAGKYGTAVWVQASDGAKLFEPVLTEVQWPGRNEAFKDVRVLNNLVWELRRIKDERFRERREITVDVPKPRWAFIACRTGDRPIAMTLDDQPLLAARAQEKAAEAMRFLAKGKHRLVLQTETDATIEELVVRCVPELIYSEYQSEPLVTAYGPFAGAFLHEHVLPNVNTLVLGQRAISDPIVPRWKQRGGKWLVHCLVPGLNYPGFSSGPGLQSANAAAAFLGKTAGFADPRFDGTIADEFSDSEPHCALYADAIRQLSAADAAGGKLFYPYADELFTGPEGRQLVQAVADTGGAVAWKNYLKTQSTEAAARRFLHDKLVMGARQYRERCPGSMDHLAVCFGYFSAPPEFLNVNSEVNYKTYLDMQLNIVANDPAFWGCYGLMSYLATYADEETVRWMSHLFRHYGINGNTARASEDPYALTHLQNPDFEQGALGWTLAPSSEKSMRVETQLGLGWLQGRYPRTREGDTGLVMTRCKERPNVLSQEIRNLVPGRYYSLRLITADTKDMSLKQQHAVSIRIDGASMADQSVTHVFDNCYSHHFATYNDKHKAWMNYHWRVFRAEGPTAMLTITDWKSPDEPGGPEGQSIIANFIHVTPYFQRN